MSSTLRLLLIIWGALTTVLVILMIYRSTLAIHEEDQLYLDEAESHMQQEQTELITRINKVNPLVRLFGAASGLLILVIAGMWVYEGLTRVQ